MTATIISRTEYKHRDEVITTYDLTGHQFTATLLEHHRNKAKLSSLWVNREFVLAARSVSVCTKLSTGEETGRWYSYHTTLKNGAPVRVTHYTYGWFFCRESCSRGVWATLNVDETNVERLTEIENKI